MRGLFIWLLLILAIPSLAVQLISTDNYILTKGETINDDVLIGSSNVTIRGTITGDLIVAAGTADISGTVNGNILVVSGNSDITAKVGGDIFAAAGTIKITGPVAGSVYTAGGTVTIGGDIARNLVVAGGTVTTQPESSIGTDLAIGGGNVIVGGTIGRDVLANAGNLTLSDTARVKRDLDAIASKSTISPGAVIGGKRSIKAQPEREAGKGPGIAGWILWIIWGGLALLLVGLPLVGFAPVLTEQTINKARSNPWLSLLIGFVTLVVTPIILLIIFFTIIGIPLSLILLALYLIAWYISPIFIALLVARMIFRKPASNKYIALLIGLLLLTVVRLIPVVGWLVMLIALLLGLGALVLTLIGRMQKPSPEVAPEASA